MFRWLTILIALVAQSMALVSPVCLVRCISPTGHECVELLGRKCHCSAIRSSETLLGCAAEKCGHDHDEEHEQDDEHDVPTGWQNLCESCSCHHSPMELTPQLQNKSLTSDVLIPWCDVLLAPATLAANANDRPVKVAKLSPRRLRESPHLALLATVVLRV